MKIRFLFDGNFDVEGKARHYRKGEIADVPEADAEPLIKGKCADLYQEVKGVASTDYERGKGGHVPEGVYLVGDDAPAPRPRARKKAGE